MHSALLAATSASAGCGQGARVLRSAESNRPSLGDPTWARRGRARGGECPARREPEASGCAGQHPGGTRGKTALERGNVYISPSQCESCVHWKMASREQGQMPSGVTHREGGNCQSEGSPCAWLAPDRAWAREPEQGPLEGGGQTQGEPCHGFGDRGGMRRGRMGNGAPLRGNADGTRTGALRLVLPQKGPRCHVIAELICCRQRAQPLPRECARLLHCDQPPIAVACLLHGVRAGLRRRACDGAPAPTASVRPTPAALRPRLAPKGGTAREAPARGGGLVILGR